MRSRGAGSWETQLLALSHPALSLFCTIPRRLAKCPGNHALQSGLTSAQDAVAAGLGRFTKHVLSGRLVIVSLLLLACLRLGTVSRAAYYLLLLVTAATHTADVVNRRGLPAAATSEAVTAYLTRVVPDATFHLILLPLACFTLPPSALAAIVCVDFDVLHALLWAYRRARSEAPLAARALGRLAMMIAPAIARKSPADVLLMQRPQRWEAVNAALISFNAFGEIALGALQVACWLTPARSMLATLAICALLRVRWLTNAAARDAWARLDTLLTAGAQHPWCPKPLRRAHSRTRAWVVSGAATVDPHAVAAALRSGARASMEAVSGAKR